jgi:HK97 gp10 family phage protein
MSDGLTLSGVQELERAFKILGDSAAKRVVRSAAQAGAAQMKREFVRAAPSSGANRQAVFDRYVRKGYKYEYLKTALRKQIKTTVVKSLESDVKILVHTSDAFWGNFLEVGTKNRKGGRGRIKAQNWMKNAFEQIEPGARDGIEKKIAQAVMREALK